MINDIGSDRIKFFDKRDWYLETDASRFSPILFVTVNTVAILRRISLFENLKRLVLGKHPMPASFLDCYLIALWIGTGIVFITEACLPRLQVFGQVDALLIIAVLIIIQVLQSVFYHELWRPVRLEKEGVGLAVSYSRVRNLLICVGNYLYVTCLFGGIYWRLGTAFLADVNRCPVFDSVFDAIYFSFTVAWSCGSLSIPPLDLSIYSKFFLVFQILSSLSLFSVIVALSIGSVQTTREKPREDNRRG